MIAGIFHQGSGLGNQLHRYVATRVLALDKGYDWQMYYKWDGSGKEAGFKGESFIEIDPKKILYEYDGPIQPTWKEDADYYNPEFNFIEDNTIIDGEFQDIRYFEHRLTEIDKWLQVEPLEISDDVCVIGFRGGEYSVYSDLFLPKEYWAEAIVLMLQKNINMRFEVHTDDEVLARQFFPNYKIIHDIGINWRSMRYAKYAIIANSSFYILPRLLCGGVTIAPRYWARHNTKTWSMPQNYYKQFTYI